MLTTRQLERIDIVLPYRALAHSIWWLRFQMGDTKTKVRLSR